MRFKRAQSATTPYINTTSLLDVVFILLLFFAVSTTFMFSGAIKVDLPKAQTTVQETSNEMVRVVITEDGNFFINDVRVQAANLSDALKTAYTSKPQATLVIEADTKTQHGLVVTVIDDGKLAGFEKFAIATEEPR